MPRRETPFVNGEYYHILNRGVAQMPIYNDTRDYKRFLKTMSYYQVKGPKPRFSMFDPKLHLLNPSRKIIDIICFCLMPNHFHLLIRQVEEKGVFEFISKLSNSYTKYFNIRNKRNGPIFQGEFKAVLIESNEQLLHLSRYIHLNPLVNNLTKDLSFYPWSSFPEYIGLTKTNGCEKKIIIEQFRNFPEYQKFVLDQADYGEQLEQIKHQMIDFPLN